MHLVDDWSKCFRSSASVGTILFFTLAIATLQILNILLSETSQSVYGQTQAAVTDNYVVRDLSWTSASLDNNLRLTTSNVITMIASISDNGNNNSAAPFLLPLPSSSRASDNNSGPVPAGPVSNTSPSNNNVDNSHSPSQGHTNSRNNVVSSNNNHIENQHKKHKHGSTVDIINQVISQSKGQFTGGEIPFP